ncbi:MAG TPA: TRAM domain-containing protein [Thermoanaerobaculia bacterium]|jgi:23S rRNA (uracil1939-C5)-methyltransferase
MNLHPGTILTITPTELVAGGDALAKIDGFPVFASNVFPGDVARVRLYEVKKGFAKADLVELVTPSPWRRAMPCPVANECGGCDWTALRLDKQLEAKRRILTESLRRIGKFDVGSLPEITVHPSPLNYRLRSRLHRDGDAVGFYAMRSNRVVPLARECEVVGVETARRPLEGEQWELANEIVRDERELTLTVNEFTYRLHTRAFFQVNRHLLGTMLRLVAAHASRVQSRKSAVDLYGGVGFFTLPIAKLFERVTMIEGSPLSARYARMNVPPHVKVIAAPVEEKMHTLPDVDFTFLDPPRAGTRREVISTIAERTKEIIAYLSCDPVTFSRDASRLIASGWRLASLDLLDLFPNTHHVETLSSFERAQ